MARIARVIVPGFPHHVTQRGNRRLPTFFSNEDYEAYRALVAEWCAKHADHSRGQLSAGRARWAAARNGTRGVHPPPCPLPSRHVESPKATRERERKTWRARRRLPASVFVPAPTPTPKGQAGQACRNYAGTSRRDESDYAGARGGRGARASGERPTANVQRSTSKGTAAEGVFGCWVGRAVYNAR